MYHLGVSSVLYIFGKHLAPCTDTVLEDLTSKVFGNCAKKRDFIQGLFDLLLHFDTDHKILENKVEIQNLLEEPSSILGKVHSLNAESFLILISNLSTTNSNACYPKVGENICSLITQPTMQ